MVPMWRRSVRAYGRVGTQALRSVIGAPPAHLWARGSVVEPRRAGDVRTCASGVALYDRVRGCSEVEDAFGVEVWYATAEGRVYLYDRSVVDVRPERAR